MKSQMVWVAVFAAGGAFAALHTYDVGDYVQDGLVINWDGIRNVGADLPHDDAASTWTDVVGGHVLTPYDFPSASGEWTPLGYRLGGGRVFRMSSTDQITFNNEFTIQIAGDFDMANYEVTANTFPNVFCANSGDDFGFFVYRNDASSVRSTNLQWRVDDYAKRPTFYNWQARYVNAAFDSTTAYFTETDAWTDALTSVRNGKAPVAHYYALGGTISHAGVGGENRTLKGVYNAFRLYSRKLTDAELAHNRLIDEIRFFDSRVLPATNVLVVCDCPYADLATEANGAYVVDGSHAFTTKGLVMAGLRQCEITGYALEAWDEANGTWGEAVEHAGETSYVYTAGSDPAKVRLTWRWRVVRALVAYDVGDYVQDGLVFQVDGVCNAGLGRPHDAEATTWKNLVPGALDMTLTTPTCVDRPGRWLENGYRLNGGSFFATEVAFGDPGAELTIQAVIRFDARKQLLVPEGSGLAYMFPTVFGVNRDTLNVYGQNRETSFSFKADGVVGSKPGTGRAPVLHMANSHDCRYVNAFIDHASSAFQESTDAPTFTPSGGEYKPLATSALCFGGCMSGDISSWTCMQRNLVGTLHALRIYNRVLTAAELTANRLLDEVRFFGSTTLLPGSVKVSAGLPGGKLNVEENAYRLTGDYEFTAFETKTPSGTYRPVAALVSEWDDALGDWAPSVRTPGATVAVSEADAGAARPRLVMWEWTLVNALRTAATNEPPYAYTPYDYARQGLVAQYDGIMNAAPGAAHDPAAEVWADLSGFANDAPLGGLDVSVGCWTNGTGYRFEGKSYARMRAKIRLANTFTVEQALDYKGTEQTLAYPNTVGIYADYGIFMGTTGMTPQWKNDTWADNRPNFNNWAGRYLTLAMNNDFSYLFEEDVWPADGSSTKARARGAKAGTAIGDYAWTIASAGPSYESSRYMKGTFYSARFYDRLLTAAELKRNRQIDEARFHGVQSVTNVWVASDSAWATGDQPAGAYDVVGEWDFTARERRLTRTLRAVPIGYTLEARQPDGSWGAPEFHDGTNYLHQTATAPADVRLTWKWELKGGTTIIVR